MNPSHNTILYNLFLHPQQAFRNIIQENPLPLMIFVFLAARLSNNIGRSLVWSSSSFMGKTMFLFGLGGEIIVILMLWIIFTCICHFTAQLLGGQGDGKDLFIGFGFASLPLTLVTPISLIAVSCSKCKLLVWLVLLFFVYLWSLILKLIAIREVYNLNFAKTVVVMLLPVLVFGSMVLLFPIISLIPFLIFGAI